MNNQGVIVTGAAAGLGRAIAARLGRDGYRVAVTDVRPHQVRVNAVCPGAIETDIWSAEAQQVDDPDAVIAEFVERMPLRRPQTADDVAGATAFLLSADANSITGQSLGVDGGLLT